MTLKQAQSGTTPALARTGLAFLALFAAAGCSGKGAEGSCPDAPSCGGDPTGTWSVLGGCQFPADQIAQALGPSENVKNPQPPVLTASPLPATTSGAWCARLFYAFNDTDPMIPNSKIREVDLPHGAPGLAPGGQISFNPDSTYGAKLNFSGGNATHFAPLCLQVGGANPSCTDLAANLTQFYVSKALPDAQGNPTPPLFDTISCVDSTQGGCDCEYNYTLTLTDAGTWLNLGPVLTETSNNASYQINGQAVAASQQPSKSMAASFCSSGASLTLSGYNGTTLSSVPGLRVLSLSK
ncbi:MAG TPA: hypothetical protein VNW92_15575 [Polyangiaceae bacterium]|nr:hypothetical protein [Polyangiaceae bacterium]